MHRCGEGEAGSVIGGVAGSVIGRPIRNTEVYILNEEGGLLPVGVGGEICIGGRGVALGYLNRAELTAEKFIDHPYKVGERLYRTGDRGRWLAGGEIEYLGRRDDQVKIRGYRIEPGEVEQVLLGYGGVREAVVVSGRDSGGGVYLAGYMVMREGGAGGGVRSYLRERLPEYMVPSYLIELEALPLSVNGKVDRKGLPAVGESELAGRAAYVGARDEREGLLVKIWEEVLGRSPVGVRDNFFESGGDSLKATKILARVYKEFGVRVDLRHLFSNASIEDLSRIMAGLRGSGGYEAIPKTEVREHYELSHAQQRLWILSQLSESSVAYHISEAYILRGKLNGAYLSAALEEVVGRHESLRTVFITEQGVPRQKVLVGMEEGFGLEEKDLRGLDGMGVRAYVEKECVRPFELERGPLWRVKLLRLGEEEYVLLLVMHHIITDGWSMEVMAEEVLELYGCYAEGKGGSLPELRIQYTDYVYWQKGRMGGEVMREHERYWLDRFSGELPVLELPLDGCRPLFRSYRGSMVEVVMGRELMEGLKEMGNRFGVTMYMTLLGAVNALLYRYTGQTDIVIGTPDAGRDHPDLERQIGVYISAMPLRTVFSKEMTFGELLGVVKEVTTEAYAHRLYPFDKLVEALDLARDMSRSPLFDVVVNFQNVQPRKEIAKKFRDIDVADYNLFFVPSAADIRWQFMEEEDRLILHLEYNAALFHQKNMDLMKDRFLLLLNQLVAQPYTRLQEIDLGVNDNSGKLEIGNQFNMVF
jgi:aryl carrier-like protein